jgi:hypothetical protein
VVGLERGAPSTVRSVGAGKLRAVVRFGAVIALLIRPAAAHAGDAGRPSAGAAGIAIAAPSPHAGATPAAATDFAYRIGVKPHGTSLHEIADALGQAAATKFPDLQLFEFEIALGDYAGDTAAQLALRNFSAVARFTRSGDQARYIDAAWLPGTFGFATIGPAQFACIANGCESGADGSETPRLHPPLRDWQIDRSDIVRAIAAHAESFSDGLMMVTVTSAIRARTSGKTIGAGGAKSPALLGLPDDHAVVVVVGAPHPCDIISPGEYWTGYLCGNYLVIDGVTGRDLDGGAYHEFHQVD